MGQRLSNKGLSLQLLGTRKVSSERSGVTAVAIAVPQSDMGLSPSRYWVVLSCGIMKLGENGEWLLIARYTRKEMGAVWSDAAKFGKWLEVELAATDTLAEAGIVPKDAAVAIR